MLILLRVGCGWSIVSVALMVADVGPGLDGGVGPGRGARPRWWAPVLVVAVVATLLALAVNVASSSGRWPLDLHVIQDEPFWSVLGLTMMAAAAFGVIRTLRHATAH